MRSVALALCLVCGVSFADDGVLSPEAQERIRIAQILTEQKVTIQKDEERLRGEPVRLILVGVGAAIAAASIGFTVGRATK